MKLGKLFMIALFVGTLGLIGCGDDGGSSDNGNGNGGNGDVCNTGGCVDNATQRTACEAAVQACEFGGISVDQCIQVAVADICEN